MRPDEARASNVACCMCSSPASVRFAWPTSQEPQSACLCNECAEAWWRQYAHAPSGEGLSISPIHAPVAAHAVDPADGEHLSAQPHERGDVRGPDAERIDLGRGMFALVDRSDLESIAGMKWRAMRIGGRHIYASCGKSPTILMHRLILDAQKGFVVDHINGDGLDNRRCNLRLCKQSQNILNRKRASCSGNPFKGISKTRHGKWRARIRVSGIRYWVSPACADPAKAADYYDAAAIAAFGEFACINFPHKHPEFSYRKAG